MTNVPEALRTHFRRHNRRVFGIAFMMLGFSLLLWALIYFFLYWVVLLLLTTLQGTAATAPPGGFFLAFASLAAGLCLMTYIEQKLWPFQRLTDHQHPLGTLMDFILSLPRMTVSAVQTLAAYHSLEETELASARRILMRLGQEGPLPVQMLAVEIADEKTRNHVLMALQWTGLVELHADEDGLKLRLANEEAKRLAQAHVRIRI